MTNEQLKDLKAYIEESVEDYDYRVEHAWYYIDRYRCPLSHADQSLYGDIERAVDDWCYDNEIDMADIDINIEELI